MMNNGVLTDEQYKVIREEAVWSAREEIHSRDYINVRQVGNLGKQTFSYDSYTDLSAAELVWQFKESKDVLNIARTNVSIPILKKDFRISERDLIASQTYGEPLNTASANSAAYRVAQLEDTLTVQGYTMDGSTYDISGLYQSANNSYSTSKDFGTAGYALAAVGGAIALLVADGITGPYDVVLNPTQYYELAASQLTGGGKEMDSVKTLIEGGNIYRDSQITAGTGMVIPTKSKSRPYFELIETCPFTVDIEPVSKRNGGGIWGIAYECVVPVVYDTDAICTMTAI